ncbi:MAG TPA: DUF4388 domain-containing protein [Mycobacteriales bacterium]|nr:DUF4388 domain-containing protein [Mycobacteriales bacterium]
MKLEGTLDAFSLPDIFSLLSMTKKTGGLHLRRSSAHGAVWFADGMITGAASDLDRQSLARRIAGSGRVSDEALTAAVTHVRLDGEAGVARVLRDADAIDEGVLHSLVTEQITDAVFDLMRWADGSFAFVVDEPNRDGVGVSCTAEDVVTEARRRLDVFASLDASVADSDSTLTVALELAADPQLTADEWSLVALVDGQRSIGEIVDLCGRGEYAVVVSLADLVARKLLQVGDGGIAALERRQEQISTLEVPASLPSAAARPAAAEVPSVEPVASFPEPATSFPESPSSFSEVAQPFPSTYEPAPAAPPAAPLPPAPYDPPAQPVAIPPAATVYEPPAPPQIAEVAPLARPVVPQRDPGPFTVGRPPVSPSDPTAVAAAPGGVPAIERDPNVNKSLLLRLIAGVRGL